MGIGKIDSEYAIREGWARDSDDEIYMDGYNAFIQVTTRDGTSGFSVKNDIGAVVFSSKSDGDGYVAKKLGVGTYYPETELEVMGKTRTNQLQIVDGATPGYVLTCDDYSGNVIWEDAYVAGSGIGEEEHRELNQLVHSIAETSYEEITRVANRITNITSWTNINKNIKIREEQISYNNENRVSQIVILQYNSVGYEVERMTETYTYSNGQIISVSRDVLLS